MHCYAWASHGPGALVYHSRCGRIEISVVLEQEPEVCLKVRPALARLQVYGPKFHPFCENSLEKYRTQSPTLGVKV